MAAKNKTRLIRQLMAILESDKSTVAQKLEAARHIRELNNWGPRKPAEPEQTGAPTKPDLDAFLGGKS